MRVEGFIKKEFAIPVESYSVITDHGDDIVIYQIELIDTSKVLHSSTIVYGTKEANLQNYYRTVKCADGVIYANQGFLIKAISYFKGTTYSQPLDMVVVEEKDVDIIVMLPITDIIIKILNFKYNDNNPQNNVKDRVVALQLQNDAPIEPVTFIPGGGVFSFKYDVATNMLKVKVPKLPVGVTFEIKGLYGI